MITFKDRQRRARSFVEAAVPESRPRSVISKVFLELGYVQPRVVRIRWHLLQYRLKIVNGYRLEFKFLLVLRQDETYIFLVHGQKS